jgi:hypothetical protein
VTGTRDRDEAGRPRNSRPRDELGRPLPRAAAATDPSAGTDLPASTGLPGATVATPAEAAGIGGRLLLDGRPFQAHEVFEDAWKIASDHERALWRGLAQIAVGLTHARRGNPRGAAAQLRRGSGNLREYQGEPAPYGIDIALVAVRADEIAGRIERDGLAVLPPEALLLPLTPRLATRSPGLRPEWWTWPRRWRRLAPPRW